MTTALKIDFISDVSCPWCVIGLRALDQALEALGDEVQAHIQGSQQRLIPGLAHRFQEAFKAPLLGAVLPYLKAQHEDGRNLAQV